MAKAIPDTIILKSGYSPLVKEAEAGATITPGDFLKRTSAGKFERQNLTPGLATSFGTKLVALENDIIGNGISDDYLVTENVRAFYPNQGDEVFTFVAASASAIVVGDILELDGAGGVRKKTAGPGIASALDAVDNSVGATKARIKIELV